VHIGRVWVGPGATVGGRSTLGPGTRIGAGAEISPGSGVSGKVPAGELWTGSPAVRQGRAGTEFPTQRPARAVHWVAGYGVSSVLLAGVPLVSALPALWLVLHAAAGRRSLGSAPVAALAWTPVATLAGLLTLALLTILAVRLLGLGVRPGYHPVRSRVGFQVWATERLLDSARTLLFPLYASLLTPGWLRALGARVGHDVEASTVLLLPVMTTIGDGAFLADDTMIASYELGGGWLHIEPAKIGKRAFLGNSGMAAPGRTVPKNGLVAVLSTAPAKSKAGTSWLGSPPVRLRRTASETDQSRTYHPPTRLKVARALVEACRLVPVTATVALAVTVAATYEWLWFRVGLLATAALGGFVLLCAGLVAGALAVVAKWVLVGRLRVGETPLWSSFVWRNEVVDAFVEIVAAPDERAPQRGLADSKAPDEDPLGRDGKRPRDQSGEEQDEPAECRRGKQTVAEPEPFVGRRDGHRQGHRGGDRNEPARLDEGTGDLEPGRWVVG
ncbi:MAG TPA: hypothetical protein VHM65_02110, partial [Candidatus Lustribacter sp.]|nr:hypothetical protein [Candidatus Lustribacter sp.]